jgi:hypothetical protein
LLCQTVPYPEPDPNGLGQYVEGLVSGRRTVTQIIREFSEFSEYAKKMR